MASSLLVRGIPVLRHQLRPSSSSTTARFITLATLSSVFPPLPDRHPQNTSDNKTTILSSLFRPPPDRYQPPPPPDDTTISKTVFPSSEAAATPSHSSDYRRWKDREAEILRDIQPVISLAKDILHSGRYMDGECLTDEDKKAVVERLLVYHPHSDDKVGSGLDSIMVDRHPQFKRTRCMFVVRTDGSWIDFSYQKCLRACLRDKYPDSAERFIREHLKRGKD